MPERRLQDDASRLSFFRMRTRAAHHSECSNQRRKRQTLEHEGYQNHAERQEDNHVTLREGNSAGKGLRQRDSRGQGYYTSHARPSHDENVTRRWQSCLLVKNAPPDNIRDVSSRKDPDQA